MNTDKKQQAKELFLQSDLNKTQIAEVLGISRRSLHYWVKEENWERLKRSAEHLPSLVVENCYHALNHLINHCIVDYRMNRPITRTEAETVYKLTLAMHKLKNRATLNETMETFAFFLDRLKVHDPALAKALAPHIDRYLSSRANVYVSDIMPANFTSVGYLAYNPPDNKEACKDSRDLFDWENELATLGYIPESRPQHEGGTGGT